MTRIRPSSRRAFTLVETLIVLTIIVGLYAVAAAGFRKAWQGQELRASAIQLASDLSLASQTAIRLGRPVQLRLYKYQAPEIASEEKRFFGYQILVRDKVLGLATPLYEMQRFQGTTVMSENGAFSTVAYTKPTKAQFTLAGDLTQIDPALAIGDYEYLTIEFRPNGRTNLEPHPAEPWSITLVPIMEAEKLPNMSPDVPVNFQTLTIDPLTGAVKMWQ